MIVDNKNLRATTSSSADRKLSIELPNARQVYTTGSPVTGIVRLGTKDLENTASVKVAIVCIVRSYHHKYYGGSTHDIRRETTKLMYEEVVLWLPSGQGTNPPPAEIPFSIVIPDVGHDKRASNPSVSLPPSFMAGTRRGWKNFGTHGTPIGFVIYHVQAIVSRKARFTHHNKALQPFIFLPTSSPPALYPDLPEKRIADPIDLPYHLWNEYSARSAIRQVFSTKGHAQLQLFLPRVTHFQRMTPVPFVMCLIIMSSAATRIDDGVPVESDVPPAPQLGKTTLFPQRIIHTCARNGRQTHVQTFDTDAENVLLGVTVEEGEWTLKPLVETSSADKFCWAKRYIWRGMWTCRETPSWENRQISWEYRLVGEVPIKGLGNGVSVVSNKLEISSGIAEHTTDVSLGLDANAMDLPPAYFEIDGTMNNDDDDADERTLVGDLSDSKH